MVTERHATQYPYEVAGRNGDLSGVSAETVTSHREPGEVGQDSPFRTPIVRGSVVPSGPRRAIGEAMIPRPHQLVAQAGRGASGEPTAFKDPALTRLAFRRSASCASSTAARPPFSSAPP